MLNTGSRSGRSGRFSAILCQRFARKNDLFLGGIGHGRHKSTRSFLTPIVKTARRTAAILVSAGLAALGRGIFRRRQIARSRAALGAPAARASATASPTAAAAAITASVSTAIAAAITASAKILAGTVATAAGGIVLRGIVTRREVLRRGSIGIRLAFLSSFCALIVHGSGRNRVVRFLEM